MEDEEPTLVKRLKTDDKIDLKSIKNMPCAERYERSYMHKDLVSNILVASKFEFIITISIDGFVKFWKKTLVGIEFVKAFKAHNSFVSAAALSKDEARLVTVCIKDTGIKVFDVANFDLI